MNRVGITLIECLIYLFLSVLLISLSTTVILNFYTKINNSFVNLKEAIDLSIIINSLSKDVRKASCNTEHWIKQQEDYIIFNGFLSKNIVKNIGWHIRDQKVFRYMGNYKNNKWHNLTASVIGNKIDNFKVKFMKSKNIINYIDFKLKKAAVELNFILVPLINRIISKV